MRPSLLEGSNFRRGRVVRVACVSPGVVAPALLVRLSPRPQDAAEAASLVGLSLGEFLRQDQGLGSADVAE
jgi:hypothetical protein